MLYLTVMEEGLGSKSPGRGALKATRAESFCFSYGYIKIVFLNLADRIPYGTLG
jgi:hypothetical protein